jgi:hypothetical protein
MYNCSLNGYSPVINYFVLAVGSKLLISVVFSVMCFLRYR